MILNLQLSPGFAHYFEKHKQEDIKDHMRVMLSTGTGFGDHAVITNPIESANPLIKQRDNFQAKDAATHFERHHCMYSGVS